MSPLPALTSPRPPRFCVAPMDGMVRSPFTVFARLISRHALLYTEMVTPAQSFMADRSRFLGYNAEEQPLPCSWAAANRQETGNLQRMPSSRLLPRSI